MSGNNTVTYTIQVPGATATKAIGEDVAAVTELLYEVYLTEATAEDQYDAKETWLYDGQATISNGTATINLELVNNQNFRVLFWAQVSGTGIYDTENLKAVKMSTALDANQESYAAFSGSDYIKYGDNLLGRTVTLYRPVSQVNIATTAESLTLGEDENGANAQTTISFKETGVTVTGLSTTYNIATGAPASDNTEFTYAAKPVSLSESTIKVNNVDYTYVGMNYVGFAPVTGDNVEVSYTITTNEVGVITNTIDNVPVKPNYRTNIIGNLITSTSDYTITLSKEWNDPEGGNMEVIYDGVVKNLNGDYEISTAAGLAYAIRNLFANGGNFYLTSALYDMTDYDVNPPVISGVTLNIYGETPVVTRAATTVTGVTIIGLDDAFIDHIEADAKVSISGVNLTDAGSVLVNTNEGELAISETTAETIVANGNTEFKADGVTDAESLQAATLTNVKVIKFANDITGNVTIVQRDGADIIIDGAGHKFDGTFYIHGQSRFADSETLEFRNIKFEHTSGTIDFISCDDAKDGTKRYAHNVTVNNCTFTGDPAAGDVVAMRYRQCYNMSVINSTATGLHSLMWATGGNGIKIDGVVLNDCKNGISFGTALNIEVVNSTISADAYGIRADAAIAADLAVKNSTLNADVPVIVRNVTTAGYNVNLGANVTLNKEGLYHVVFTSGSDNAAYVAPAVEWNLTGADDLCVFPGPVIASNDKDIDLAMKAGVTEVTLTEGAFIVPDTAQGKKVTFIGKGDKEKTFIATQDDGSYEGCDYSLDGSTVTFENITITTNSEIYTGYARCKGTYKNCIINGTFTLYDNSVFEGCTFNVSGDVYNIWTWGAPEATFTKCTFNSDGKAILLYGGVNTKLTLNGCTFNDNGGLTDLKAAVEIGNDYNTSYELIVNDTVVNGYEINDKGINTGTTLWANKNSMGKDKLNVVVDGVDVY